MRRGNPDFMNGVPELLLLQLLATREMYGYELVQSIREQTAEAIQLSEGVVYPTLHALEKLSTDVVASITPSQKTVPASWCVLQAHGRA